MDLLENSNPNIFKKSEPRKITVEELQENIADPIDDREIFDLIRDIRDPEHPLTLEELHVLELKNIVVNSDQNEVTINFTPTIPHCSMATLIGLSIRVRLLRSLSPRYKVSVEITPGTHASEHAINKQLADKERVAAALENQHLCGVINECIAFSKEKYDLLSRGVKFARDENFENVVKHSELDFLHEYEDIIKIIHNKNVLSENIQSIQNEIQSF